MKQFKLLAWTSVSDLIPLKKTPFEHVIDIALGEKPMFLKHSLAAVYASLREAGVDGIELLIPVRCTDENIRDVLALLQKYKMPVFSLHQSLNSFTQISMTEIVRLCTISKRTKARNITLHSAALGKKLFDPTFVAELKQLQKDYDVIFGIENMPRTPLWYIQDYTFNPEKFSAMIATNGLNVTFDTTHVGQVAGDVLAFYKQNQKHIVNIHLSDYRSHWLNTRFRLQNYTHLPLLTGELPVPKLLQSLKKAQYAGLITMEIKGSLAELCTSAKLIKGV